MEPVATRVVISRERISRRIAELGAQVTSELTRELGGPGSRLVLVPILTGSMIFLADLIRHIPLKMSVRPVTIASYPGPATASQGAQIRGDLPTDLGGAHVLIVDDILDSGRTLGLLRRMMLAQHPASLRIAVLLRKHKPGGRDDDVAADYVGFDIGDEFVVGYGLDYDGYFRNLPDIAVPVFPPGPQGKDGA
ncbi:MAG TPA: hypoxanthine phosphoribosyltransferase [Phycisphaerales bacterium]|nr:hypoxanthine phosphoribosyltransferase [Phycisphaerales bacterium]